jgi:hypothetical protein
MMQKFTGRQPKEAAYRGSNEKKETRKATVQKKKKTIHKTRCLVPPATKMQVLLPLPKPKSSLL